MTLQDAQRAVNEAKAKLTEAQAQLDAAIHEPETSPYMKCILRDIGEFYKPRIEEDNPTMSIFRISFPIEEKENSGIFSNFKRLHQIGLFVGNVGRKGDRIYLNFFTNSAY